MSSPWSSVGCGTWLLFTAGGLQLVGVPGKAAMVVGVLVAFGAAIGLERRNRRARIEEMREAQKSERW